MKDHKRKTSGWTNQVSECDFAHWWDCGFWCSNDKIFGNKVAYLRSCPSRIPKYKNCKLKKEKHG